MYAQLRYIHLNNFSSFDSVLNNLSIYVLTFLLKLIRLQKLALALCCQIYTVTDETRVAVWLIPFLINVFLALFLFLMMSYHRRKASVENNAKFTALP